jgi:conjugal transfer pilus assembly protein TraW
MRFRLIFFIHVTFGVTQAKDLGVYGPTFEIKERNLLEVIHHRLQDLQVSNKLSYYQDQIQKRVWETLRRPLAVEGIGKVATYQKRIYDPTITVQEDLKDHDGQIFARKGEKYNPLDTHSFGKPLLFINGDDSGQLQWALSQMGKIVLVQGNPLDLEKKHQSPFYFDQGSTLTRKLGITQVPARVSQQDNILLIEEIPHG